MLRVVVVKAVRCPVPASFIRAVVRAAGDAVGVVPGELTVRIAGGRELRRLNRSFMGVDEATDVLSFPLGGGGYLGDIAISWPAAVAQALEYGHPQQSELALLCVHGLLHLLGRDHATPDEEREMWDETRKCLAAAGVSISEGRLPLRS